MEPGESTEGTPRREVREETGLELDTLQLFDVFPGPDFHLRLKNEDEFYSVTVAYTSRTARGELQTRTSPFSAPLRLT
jgi:ADP-ribose pyrophosphatase YjhB (NUDIX family)